MHGNVGAHIVILLVSFLVLIPSAIVILNSSEKLQRIGILVGMIFLIFSPSLQINFLADETYVKGTTQAYEICYLDFFAVIYFVLLLKKPNFRFHFGAPGLTLFFLCFATSALSFVNAPNTTYAMFELFRLAKMGFFFVVMYNILLYYNCFETVIEGLAIGIFLNFFDMVFQKYGLGRYASIGFLKHKNSAGMYFNMLMPTFLYIGLNLDLKSKKKRMFYIFMFFACTASTLFTVSRGAWAIAALDIAVIVSISLLGGITPKKMWVMAILGLAFVAGIIKSYDTLYERFTVGNEAGTKGRKLLVVNATDMANKNFFGVGFNNYTEANTFENNYGDIFNTLNIDSDRNAGKVETIYMLTAAETGWIGLAALLIWYLYYFVQGLICCFYYRKSNMYYLAIGLTVALGGAYLHSTLEWSLRYSQNFYQLIVVFALIAALVYFREVSPKKTALNSRKPRAHKVKTLLPYRLEQGQNVLKTQSSPNR